MKKVELGPKPLVFPLPAVLVGANVSGKPNFMTAAWVTPCNMDPPMVAAALNKVRYTLQGIAENNTFSINVPSADMAMAVDYCGVFSGRKADKSGVFEVFYGKLGSAPMVSACPVNIECRLLQRVALKTHELVIGEIVESYCAKECMKDGSPDASAVNPLVFAIGERGYYTLGERVGDSHSMGRDYRPD